LTVREHTYKPFIYSNILFTACGKDGIDIHIQNDDKKYKLVKTLGVDELDISMMTNNTNAAIDIRDIHIFSDGKMYILCHNTGFHTYQFDIQKLKVVSKNGCI